MNHLSQALLNEAALGRMLSHREVSRFSPTEIRQAIAELVAQDKVALASALCDAGLSLYPENEEILAISALMAEMQQDWVNAQELLEKLIIVQNGVTQVATWQHLIRVLRCQCEPHNALQAIDLALQMHPDHPVLLAEQASLQALVSDSTLSAGSELRH